VTKCSVSKEIEFDAGHRVPNHASKCRNPHGHRYRVRVVCVGSIIEVIGASDQGMLIDFGNLKVLMQDRIHDVLDHGFIVWESDEELLQCFWEKTDWKVIAFPYIPTAENIAIWCWEQLEDLIKAHWRGNLELMRIDVWETPTSQASYEGIRNGAALPNP